jgi:DNA-binding LytR/AlgR family response regulator
MPGKTGFDLLHELDHTPGIIFTTAYDEYALRAFDVNALDYLLKPIEPKRLAEAIHKLEDLDEGASSVSETPKLTQNETSTEKASENKVESIQSDQPLESTSEKSKLEKKEPVLMASNSQNKSAIRSDVSTTNQPVAFSDVFMEEMDLKMETSTSSAAKPFLVSENAHVLDLLTPCF